MPFVGPAGGCSAGPAVKLHGWAGCIRVQGSWLQLAHLHQRLQQHLKGLVGLCKQQRRVVMKLGVHRPDNQEGANPGAAAEVLPGQTCSLQDADVHPIITVTVGVHGARQLFCVAALAALLLSCCLCSDWEHR